MVIDEDSMAIGVAMHAMGHVVLQNRAQAGFMNFSMLC